MRALAHSGAALTALCAAPVVLVGAALRPAWRAGLGSRLGAAPRREPGAIWIHAASVGETIASLALHDAFAAAGVPTFASSLTLTGRQVLRQRRPALPGTLAPLDHPWCVSRALDRVHPRALVLVETELWPAWIAAAARRRVPVIVVSARLSDRSFPRYRRLAFAVAPTLRRLAAVGARSPQDAQRFVALGVPEPRVEVTGDLKLEPSAHPPPVVDALAAVLGNTRLFVAGSTHADEEAAALASLAAAEQAGHPLALVLAPRHPERTREVERCVRRAGRICRLRSRLGTAPLEPGQVLVLDTVGELAGIYAKADLAFVGGSLSPRGGHNVLEPVLAGCPVLFGPHTENMRDAAESMLACGAGRRVNSSQELAQAVVTELADPQAARSRAARGREVLDRHRGAGQRSVALIQRVLDRTPP